MSGFKLPPISTLIGSPLHNYLQLISQNQVGSAYLLKAALTGLISAFGVPFRWYESLAVDPKANRHRLKNPPVFILGHWRSGTTLLHNTLCQAPDAAFVSTYHSVFPNNLGSKAIFKSFMKASMPDRRPSDNVKLSVDFPQEEEFTLGNLHPFSYYHFWYFPRKQKEYFNRYALFNNANDSTITQWKRHYRKLLNKAVLNTEGTQLFVKNPVNTARIPLLLETYPEAKFIHIYRNPIVVYLSTYKFFAELFPTLWFHKISEDEIKEMILWTYPAMMEQYFATRDLIPAQNLIEVKYEEFASDPLPYLENIFKYLRLDGFEQSEPAFYDYLNSQKSHRVNSYQIERKLLNEIQERWWDTIKRWGYDVPPEVEVIEQ